MKTLTLPALMNLSLYSVYKTVRRFLIQRRLHAIAVHIEHIRHQRQHDFHVERVLQGREAILQSELHSL